MTIDGTDKTIYSSSRQIASTGPTLLEGELSSVFNMATDGAAFEANAEAAPAAAPVNKSGLLRDAFNAIVQAAAMPEAIAAGLTVDILGEIARIESSGGRNNINGSYRGLFQLDSREKEYRGKNLLNPYVNARLAVRELTEKVNKFEAKYGRKPLVSELYMSHQQGICGGPALLNNPNLPAWKALVNECKLSAKKAQLHIKGNIPESAFAHFSGTRDTLKTELTSAQFVSLWTADFKEMPYKDALARLNAKPENERAFLTADVKTAAKPVEPKPLAATREKTAVTRPANGTVIEYQGKKYNVMDSTERRKAGDIVTSGTITGGKWALLRPVDQSGADILTAQRSNREAAHASTVVSAGQKTSSSAAQDMKVARTNEWGEAGKTVFGPQL